MAISDLSGDGLPNHEIPSASTADTTTESPATMQSSPIGLGGLENARDNDLKDTESGYFLAAPPTVESHEVELPPLTNDFEDNEQRGVFRAEIPDSDALSDESSNHNGGDDGRAEMRSGESSKTCAVDEAAAHQHHVSKETAVDVPASEEKDEQMQDASNISQFPGLSGAEPILSEADQGPLSNNLAIATEDLGLFDAVALSIENNISNDKSGSAMDAKVTTPIGAPRTDIERRILIITLSPSGPGLTEDPTSVSEPALDASTNETTAVYVNCQNPTSIPGPENPQTELDMPGTNLGTPQTGTSPINIRKANIEPEALASLATPSVSISSSVPAKLDTASKASPEKQDKGFVSTEGLSLAKTEEGKSSQSQDIESKTTPITGPTGSHSKDVMIAELKAMKIVSENILIILTKSFFNR